MKASSVFSASCRYMVACCRKYSSQSMLRRALQGHERIMSARSAHANPCARGRMMVVAPAVATTMVWGTPWLGSILIESQTRPDRKSDTSFATVTVRRSS